MTTGVAGEDGVDSISKYLSNHESCSIAVSLVKKEKQRPEIIKQEGWCRECLQGLN